MDFQLKIIITLSLIRSELYLQRRQAFVSVQNPGAVLHYANLLGQKIGLGKLLSQFSAAHSIKRNIIATLGLLVFQAPGDVVNDRVTPAAQTQKRFLPMQIRKKKKIGL